MALKGLYTIAGGGAPGTKTYNAKPWRGEMIIWDAGNFLNLEIAFFEFDLYMFFFSLYIIFLSMRIYFRKIIYFYIGFTAW